MKNQTFSVQTITLPIYSNLYILFSIYTVTSANLGGTNLIPALEFIFKEEADTKYPRQIFILTGIFTSNKIY